MLLLEFHAGENPAVQNSELHTPLRIIPETFEVALLAELRLSLYSRIEVLPFLGHLPVDAHQEASHRGRTVVRYRPGREIKLYSAPRSVLAVAAGFMSSLSG